MPDFTVIEGKDNVIDLDKRLNANLDGSEDRKLLAALKKIRGDNITGGILLAFTADGGLDLSMTSNAFDRPANIVYAAELLKSIMIDNSEF